MSQPTVARRIEALEHVLGVTLFEKDTRGFHPTDMAKAILADTEKAEAAIASLAHKVAETRRDSARVIKITAPSMSFSNNFATIIADFTANHPEAQFEFVSSNKVLDLFAGEADLAVRFAAEIQDTRLICTKLTTVRSALYASKDYISKYGFPSTPAEFAGHKFIAYSPSRSSHTVNTWLEALISPDQVVSRCPDPESAITTTKAGFGISPLPVSIANSEESLVRCGDIPEEVFTKSWLVISPQAYRRPEVKAFAAFFAPRFRAMFAYTKSI